MQAIEVLQTALPMPTAASTPIKNKHSLNDHSYAVTESPRKLKRKLFKEVCKTQKVTKRLKMTKQKLRRLQKKVKSMKQIIQTLKRELYLSHNAAEIMEQQFSEIPLELFRRMPRNKEKLTRQKYPPHLRSFALTLQFYSTKAYKYVRETFCLGLPHPATISQWYSSFEGKPGFTNEAFVALKNVVTKERAVGKEVRCALMLDEMSIKKAVEYDGK